MQIPPEELPTHSAELLQTVLTKVLFDPKTRPHEFLISLLATRLLEFAQDIILLESNGKSATTPVIARAMLEHLFKLAVAAEDPELANRISLLELEWDLIQTKMPGSRPRDLSQIRLQPDYASIGKMVRELSKRWGFPEDAYLGFKRFSTWQWAHKAGLDSLYKNDYAQLSNYAHAVTNTFLLRERRAYVLEVATRCLLEASERIAQRYTNSVPQAIHDQISGTRNMFDAHHKSRRYLELFAKELFGEATARPSRPGNRFKNN